MRVLPTILTAVTLTLSACGGSGSTAPGGQSPSLSITIATNPIASGTSAQASATITDASGNTSPASGVTWSSANPSVANINATGLVTGFVAGTATILAQSGGVTGQASVTVTHGAPASVSIYSGDGQSGNHGSQLPDPLCVLVKDASGNVVPGVVATYSVATGGGSLSFPTAPSTDGLGVAISGLWSLGSLVGQQTVLASVSGAGSVTFKATAQ
jgi:Bacterial Ig-like domain (group 2)